MDFFASQDAARKKTGLLLFYFGLAVLSIIVAVYIAFAFFFAYQRSGSDQFSPFMIWDLELFITVAGVTLLVVVPARFTRYPY
jgi:hypothetical protein